MKQLRNILIFLIVPLTLAAFNLMLLKNLQYFYLSWSDPAYAYMFNGLNLSRSDTDIGHTDHPGTPLQLFSAMVIRTTFLLTGDELIEVDVIKDPEKYAHAISYSLIALNMFSVFLLGFIINRKTGKMATALFLQLALMLSFVSIFFIPAITCESLLFPVEVLLILLIYFYIFSPGSFHRWTYLTGFSLLSGLLAAIKISSLPILLVPLILLKEIKDKTLYLSLTLLSFGVFVAPAIPKLIDHWDFMVGIMTHTGKYGGGEKGIIDWSDFFTNLGLIFSKEIPFTLIFFIFLIAVLIPIKNQESKQSRRLLLVIVAMISVQVLITAKHYAYHYLVPAHLLMGVGIVGIERIVGIKRIVGIERIKGKKILPLFGGKSGGGKIAGIAGVVWVAGVALYLLLVFRLFYIYDFDRGFKNPRIETQEFAATYGDLPRVTLNVNSWEGIWPESSLYFGISYSGGNKFEYLRIADSLYPESFFYSTMRKDFFSFKGLQMKEQVFSRYPELIIYNRNFDSLELKNAMAELTTINTPDSIISWTRIYHDVKTRESLFLIKADTHALKSLFGTWATIECDLETWSDSTNSYIDRTGRYSFIGSMSQGSNAAFSGANSIRLTPDDPYGMEINLPAHPGDFYQLSAWRHPHGSEGLLVASCPDAQKFYKAGAIVEDQKGSWEKIIFSFLIPDDYSDTVIKIYLWNPGNEPVNFDDLHYSITYSK